MDSPRSPLGKRIRDAREERSRLLAAPYRQRDLAAAVGVDPATVSRWERGRTEPRTEALRRVAAALGQPLGSFFEPFAAPAPSLRGAAPAAGTPLSFDAFVVGPGSRVAHDAALAVADGRDASPNPLLLRAGPGLGKTHLLRAIEARLAARSPSLRVRYVTTETLANEFVDALGKRQFERFRRRYRACDVLLVDDLQFLERKDAIREEFAHIFAALCADGRRLVLGSDRSAGGMRAADERMRERFENGLVVEIPPPELETRVAILRRRLERAEIECDPDVLAFVAGRSGPSVASLHGALTRVLAFARLASLPLTPATAEAALRHAHGASAPAVTLERIVDVVSERFGLEPADLARADRSPGIVYPRQVAMYLVREMTGASLPAIGRAFGGRDHINVVHALARIERLRREHRAAYDLLKELEGRVSDRR